MPPFLSVQRRTCLWQKVSIDMNPNRPDHEFKSTSGGWGCQEELFAARLLKYGIQDLVGNIKQVSGEVAGLPGYSAWLTACLYGVPVHSYVRALTPTSLHFPPPPGYTGIAFVTAFACSEWNAWNHAVLRCVQHDGLRTRSLHPYGACPNPPLLQGPHSAVNTLSSASKTMVYS